MSNSLYQYYEEELNGFRQRGREFSEAYPSAAGRLRLDRSQSVDPHVERLIESFAFMNARIRKKLDDDFPELTDALLSILYPHFIAPRPSMTTVQFSPEAANLPPTGLTIDRHSSLRTQKIDGVTCRFRTCYPVHLWPVEVVQAKLIRAPFLESFQPPAEARAAIVLTLRTTHNETFGNLSLDQLRFHLDGDDHFTAKLYELLFNRTTSVEFRSAIDPGNRFCLDPTDCLCPVGFESADAMLPYPKNSFVGYQLLTELFSFPEKFAYVDLSDFREVARKGLGNQIDVIFYLTEAPERMEYDVNAKSFKLGCTPVVNLFQQICEPIHLSQKKSSYAVTADVHHQSAFEIYSVDSVKSADPHNQRVYHPFYSFRKPVDSDTTDAFWFASRKQSLRAGDQGTQVELHFVDPQFDPRLPAEAALTVTATCSNRDLPAAIEAGHETLNFQLESAIPVKSVQCLHFPTPAVRPPLGHNAQWQLISHLSLNHLSIANTDDALDSFKQLLRLYNFSDSNAHSRRSALNRQMIDGVQGIESRRVTRRIGSSGDSAFCRGIQIEMYLDEDHYVGVGAYLFASVMRQFLTKYASINSFAELLVRTKQREEPMCYWPPIVGQEQVI